MSVQTLSLQQQAEVVSDLSRGKTAPQVAARRHLDVAIVAQMETLFGPSRAELSRNSKVLNKKLRDERNRGEVAEEFDVDVPLSDGPADGEVDRPDVVLWRCTVTGCGFDLVGPTGIELGEVQAMIAEHQDTHTVGFYRCSVEGCSFELNWAGRSANPEDDREVDEYIDQQIEQHTESHAQRPRRAVDEPTPGELAIAASVPAHNHTDEEVRYPTCPACRAESEVPLVIEGQTVEIPGGVSTRQFLCEECGWELWAASEEYLIDVQRAIDAHVNAHQVEDGPITQPIPEPVPDQVNGSGPELAGNVLAQLTLTSPVPAGEGTPAASGVERAGVVEEPPASPPTGHEEPPSSWAAGGVRTVERLLDAADKSDNPRLQAAAGHIRQALQDLADALDRWVDQAEQRKAIHHELDILGRKQSELIEKLARLNAAMPDGHFDLIQTPTSWRDAAADVLQPEPAADVETPTPKPAGFEVFPKKGPGFTDKSALWFRMDSDARARVKPWAESNGVYHASTGRQPKATVEAYLAAHPEDDPR